MTAAIYNDGGVGSWSTQCQVFGFCPKPVAFIVTLQKGKDGYLCEFATCASDLKPLIERVALNPLWLYVRHRGYVPTSETEEEWA